VIVGVGGLGLYRMKLRSVRDPCWNGRRIWDWRARRV